MGTTTDPEDALVLEAYALSPEPPRLVSALAGREWMEADGRNAFRCLPLTIGNAYGWQLLLPVDVTASWNGGASTNDVSVLCSRPHQAVSNFANGILTFHTGYIFRTPKQFHIMVMGPTNTFKDGVSAMTAVVESDWLPYSFTMNYKFTRACTVNWKAGDPFAQIFLVPDGVQERVQPTIQALESNPQLVGDRAAWRQRRVELRERLTAKDPDALRVPWGKDYFLGRYADGREIDAIHTRKLKLKSPITK
jgi:hypothetical protein